MPSTSQLPSSFASAAAAAAGRGGGSARGGDSRGSGDWYVYFPMPLLFEAPCFDLVYLHRHLDSSILFLIPFADFGYFRLPLVRLFRATYPSTHIAQNH